MKQIVTTREQSKKLQELGISADTADMSWHFTDVTSEVFRWKLQTSPLTTKENFSVTMEKLTSPFWRHADGSPMTGEEVFDKIFGKDLPAWSLGALIAMLPDTIVRDDKSCCGLSILNMGVYYQSLNGKEIVHGCEKDSIFENCIDMIVWLVNEGHIKTK